MIMVSDFVADFQLQFLLISARIEHGVYEFAHINIFDGGVLISECILNEAHGQIRNIFEIAQRKFQCKPTATNWSHIFAQLNLDVHQFF